MADYIDREELLKIWENADSNFDYCELHFIESIKAQSSVDAVEVVRCKDCKYRNKDFCLRLGKLDEEQNSYFLIVKDSDFCKWGEKE